jgi:murein endopeptidase
MRRWFIAPALLAAITASVILAASHPWSRADTDSGGAAATARAPEGPQRTNDRRRSEHAHRARIAWRDSRAVGLPHAGGLEAGVRLPREGAHFFTWDPIRHQRPNRTWRRWGTDDLVRVTLGVIRDYAAAHPRAPRVAVGDLSRPRGGDFGPEFGLPGHVSHQNGLDVDLYYPRQDRHEVAPESVDQIDLRLSQDLVDRFVEAGAESIFVGPNTGLTGPPDVVTPLVNHDNHLHVRLPGLTR